MERVIFSKILLCALLVLGVEAASAQEVDFNKKMKEYGLVDVQALDKEIRVELKYATEDNFVGENMYGSLTTAYLLPHFAQSLWYEMRRRGVSVTAVYPSAVDTPFYDLDDGMRRLLLRCGAMLSAESVARKALRAMFRSRRRCIPGLLPKIEAALCWLLPAWALLPILKIPVVRRILDKI